MLGLTPDGTAQAAVAIATLLVLISTLRSDHRRSQNETIVEFNRRYEGLWEYIYNDSNDPNHFFDKEKLIRRYWSLQLDQYEAWCRGYLPSRQFRIWLRAREHDFKSSATIGGILLSDSIDIAKRTIGNIDFWRLIDAARIGHGDGKIPLPSRRWLI